MLQRIWGRVVATLNRAMPNKFSQPTRILGLAIVYDIDGTRQGRVRRHLSDDAHMCREQLYVDLNLLTFLPFLPFHHSFFSVALFSFFLGETKGQRSRQ